MVDFALNSVARSIGVSRYTCISLWWDNVEISNLVHRLVVAIPSIRTISSVTKRIKIIPKDGVVTVT